MDCRLYFENKKECAQRVAEAKDTNPIKNFKSKQGLSGEKRTKKGKEQFVKKSRTAQSETEQKKPGEKEDIIELTQASMESINDNCLLEIFKYLQRKDLQSLLYTCHRLNSIVHTHDMISKKCTTFEIKGRMVEKDEKCIASVVSHISNYVSALKIDCGRKRCSDLSSVFNGCKNLKYLRIDNWNIDVFQIDPTLCVELELWWVKVNNDFFNLLKQFRKLQLLVININTITHHNWELDTTIDWPTNLKQLRLGGFEINRNFLLSTVEQLESLEIIDLWTCKVPTSEIVAFENKRELHRQICSFHHSERNHRLDVILPYSVIILSKKDLANSATERLRIVYNRDQTGIPQIEINFADVKTQTNA